MTHLLCHTGPETTRCDAKITAWGEDEKGNWIAVDRTVFIRRAAARCPTAAR
ncbi:MAG: hypothetical protein E7C36_09105 [Mixta calida]|uniref:hypothetical protein n=1 Tax=Mixta TaxID=2100764 RepID=UPI001331820D|nr:MULTISPECIES: hypothetical protein [Mixta]MBS6059590.1 hypothetical protein [Pantoea sp.]MCR1565916.1 hypothetical protein [Mixta sp.]MDU2733431.1 hypothetical protein [Mixta calida]MDU3078189.1 hypothetical protein [Mixta calida]MDU3814819.1 hypothetical protein [Pantoea sp.]